MSADPQGCADCAAHEAGICWSHKCKAIRAGKSHVVVGRTFRDDRTVREMNRAEEDAMRATGRDYDRVR